MFASLNPGHIALSLDLIEGLDAAQQYGFGGYDATIECLHAYACKHGPSATVDAFAARNLKIGNWNLHAMPYAIEEAAWPQFMAELKQYAHTASAVGAYRSSMWVFPGHNELNFDQNYAHHLQRFTEVARLLSEFGIRLGLEFVGPKTLRDSFRFPFVHTLGGMCQLVSDIGNGAGLLMDSWHWYASGGTVSDLEQLKYGSVTHVHINDAPALPLDKLVDNQRKQPLETGLIDLKPFLNILEKKGYYGPVTVEAFDDELNALPAEKKLQKTADATLKSLKLLD